MDELVSVMQDILLELQSINSKLDDVKGDGLYNSLTDVCEKIDGLEASITSNGRYDLGDICDEIRNK